MKLKKDDRRGQPFKHPKKYPKVQRMFNERKHTFERRLNEFIRVVLERPRFSTELYRKFSSDPKLYRELKIRGFPIQRTPIIGKSHNRKSKSSCRERITIYYFSHQRNEAYNLVVRKYPAKASILRLPILDGYFDKSISEVKL